MVVNPVTLRFIDALGLSIIVNFIQRNPCSAPTAISVIHFRLSRREKRCAALRVVFGILSMIRAPVKLCNVMRKHKSHNPF